MIQELVNAGELTKIWHFSVIAVIIALVVAVAGIAATLLFLDDKTYDIARKYNTTCDMVRGAFIALSVIIPMALALVVPNLTTDYYESKESVTEAVVNNKDKYTTPIHFSDGKGGGHTTYATHHDVQVRVQIQTLNGAMKLLHTEDSESLYDTAAVGDKVDVTYRVVYKSVNDEPVFVEMQVVNITTQQ
jgi:hypothetical protein